MSALLDLPRLGARLPAGEAGQAGIVKFLKDPAAHGGQPVTHIVTHISHIFLAGDDAWKLKRAVSLPFVDFSALEARHRACEAEIRLNRRTAPEIYLGVVPVTLAADGHFGIAGPGRTVDWLVHMRRFPSDALLSDLAGRQALTPAIIDDLGDAIAAFHGVCEVVRGVDGAAIVADVFGGLQQTQDRALARLIGQRRLSGWREVVKAEIERLAPALRGRGAEGFVRHCHGDLHLGNIVMLEGRPVPFDAIEFSEDMATTDVLYDLAFAVMDLISRGELSLANRLMNRYLSATRDYDGLAVWPLFLSIRAAIRAAVLALKKDAAEARRYFRTAERVLRAHAPRLIAVGGLSGSGKSTYAGNLAPAMGEAAGAVVLNSDVVRKRLFGKRPEQKLPASAYEGAVSAQVYDRLLKDAETALRAGASVVADATFLRAADRGAIAQLAERLDVPFSGRWMDVAPDELRRRVRARDAAAEPVASDAGIAVLEHQLAEDTGPITWQRVEP